jgi:predicted transcriptional regulator
MVHLNEEKRVLLEAIGKIKEETSEKRKNLLSEKEKLEGIKRSMEQMDRARIEVERISDENKEIKNVML